MFVDVRNWGSTPEERSLDYPCDVLLDQPAETYFRAIDVAADPHVLFRWLCQMRVAPYSYDLIDNLGRRSPRELTPGVDQLEVGQRFMTMFTLVAFERDEHLTFYSDHPLFGEIGITYRVFAAEGAGSRLVVKFLWRSSKGALGTAQRLILPTGDLFMMRRQLLTLGRLAERDQERLVLDWPGD